VPGRRRGADLRHRRAGMEPDLHRRRRQGMDPRAGRKAGRGAAGRGEDRGLPGTGAGFLQALRRCLPGRRRIDQPQRGTFRPARGHAHDDIYPSNDSSHDQSRRGPSPGRANAAMARAHWPHLTNRQGRLEKSRLESFYL